MSTDSFPYQVYEAHCGLHGTMRASLRDPPGIISCPGKCGRALKPYSIGQALSRMPWTQVPMLFKMKTRAVGGQVFEDQPQAEPVIVLDEGGEDV